MNKIAHTPSGRIRTLPPERGPPRTAARRPEWRVGKLPRSRRGRTDASGDHSRSEGSVEMHRTLRILRKRIAYRARVWPALINPKVLMVPYHAHRMQPWLFHGLRIFRVMLGGGLLL